MPDDAKEESLLTYIERLEDIFENRISELEHELKRVEIIATAKAVVVPEGKGIFWTNKISELEKNIENWLKRLSDDQIKIENKIAELKQKFIVSNGKEINLDSVGHSIEKHREEIKKVRHDFVEKNRIISDTAVSDNSKLRERINIDIKKHDKDIVDLREEIAELQTKQQLITEELQNLNIWRRKHLGKYNALKEALHESYLWSIEASKRHIKKLRRFGKDMADWNMYVVEEWKSIRHKKGLLKKLSGEKEIHHETLEMKGTREANLGMKVSDETSKPEEPSNSKNIIFPTKLTYEDEHPEDSEYKTPESVKFIKEFDFKKEEPKYILSADGYCLNPKKLIAEFLNDWKWGNALKNHKWNYLTLIKCKCPHHTIFWKWFEKKWEQKLQEEQKNDG